MVIILIWLGVYDITVAASILLLGNPSTILGDLSLKSLLMLLLDWRFLLGGLLALGARFIFVIINNLTAKHPSLSHAHLSLTALATITSVVVVLLANHFILHERFNSMQMLGTGIVLFGLFLVFR